MADKKDKKNLISREQLASGLGMAGKLALKTGKLAVKVGMTAGKAAVSGAKLAGNAVAKKIEEANETRRIVEEELKSEAEAEKAVETQPEPELAEAEAVETEEAEEVVESNDAEEATEAEVVEEATEAEEEEEETVETEDADETAEEIEPLPRQGRVARNTDAEKKPRRKGVIPVAILAILVAIFGITFAMSDAKAFADGAVLNGVDVGGKNVKQTSELMNKRLNNIKLCKDGASAKKIKTSFTYENKNGIKNLMKLSHMDIRKLFGSKLKYKLKFTAADGRELTAASLKKAFPIEKGETVTKDAYINYGKMKIVDEVQGTNMDYLKLADAVSEFKGSNPLEEQFDFEKKAYRAEPEVVASDLDAELEFAKETLADGMDIINLSGKKVHIGPYSMSKIILYNGGNTQYSEEGAVEVARELSKDYKADRVTIKTQEGKKTLNNYAITGAIDAEKTGKAIVEAAKNGKVGKIYADKNQTAELGDHVEVSLSSQTVYLIQDGRVTMKSPVVTGTYGHRTPPGIFALSWKASPSVLSGKNDDGSEYENPVNFWMPFNGGIGLHDAPWRGAFGGSIYVSNGSHGCVNLPYDTAKTIYNAINAGDIIVVF